MLRGLCAVAAGVSIALCVGVASAGRPTTAKIGSVQVSDPGVTDGRAMSIRGAFPAPTAQTPVVPTQLPSQSHLLSESEATAIWLNGEVDGVSGLASQLSLAETADDFVLEEGAFYQIDKVELVMAVLPNGPVEAQLRFFEDCNGKPGLQLGSYPSTEAINIGTNPNFPGLTFYRFIFNDLGIFQEGGVRFWLSPQGPANGLYFWLTGNSGIVQGSQGQYRSAGYGYPDWTSVDDLCSECFGICTDFNFRVCGKVCWLIHDNGDYSLDGFPSQGFPGLPIYLSNSFDNFQIPPGEPVTLCRLEMWLATNCDPNRVYIELYDNDCDSPSGTPITMDRNTPGWQTPERVMNGDLPRTVQGLPVYKFVVECPGLELRDGRNYWLTIALHWFGSPHEHAIWLFGPEGDCEEFDAAALGGGAEYRILITEGRYRSDFLGVPYFAPISEILNDDPTAVGGDYPTMSKRRDFAFRLWTGKSSGQLFANDPRLMITSGSWDGQATVDEPPPELVNAQPGPPSPTGGR